MMKGVGCCAMALNRDCDYSDVAAEGEANARCPTRCVSRDLRLESLQNKLHAGVYLLDLSVLRLHRI